MPSSKDVNDSEWFSWIDVPEFCGVDLCIVFEPLRCGIHFSRGGGDMLCDGIFRISFMPFDCSILGCVDMLKSRQYNQSTQELYREVLSASVVTSSRCSWFWQA